MMWILALLPLVSAVIPTPTITPLHPSGVRWEIPDNGYTLVAVHFNINQDLPNVQAGTYNVDINTKQGSMWVYQETKATVHPGDTIHYWLYAVKQSGEAEQDLNDVWTYSDGKPVTQAPATEKPVTQAPTTEKPVTQAPATEKPVTQAPTTEKPVTQAPTTEKPATHPHGHQSHTEAPTEQVQPVSQTGGQTVTGLNTDVTIIQKDCDDQPVCTSYPCLIFDDEFDTFDLKTWEHEITAGGGGNWEFQYYNNNRTNSYVKNGVLYLKPTLTTDQYGLNFLEHGKLELWGAGPHDTCTGNQWYGCQRDGAPGRIINPIQSAKIRSSRGFNFKYGKVEIEAKLPKGDWLWPAIWMMPTYDAYGGWPSSGEIDIMESRGNRNYHDAKGQSQGVNHMGSTLHFGPDFFSNKWELAHAEKDATVGTYGDGFHKYGLEWTEDHLRFLVDNQEILKVDPGKDGFWKFGGLDKTQYDNPWAGRPKMAPFDQEFYIIMNVAVGGLNYFPDTNTNAGYQKPWKEADQMAFWNARNLWYPTWHPTTNNGEDAALQVNYVKVWKLKP